MKPSLVLIIPINQKYIIHINQVITNSDIHLSPFVYTSLFFIVTILKVILFINYDYLMCNIYYYTRDIVFNTYI